MKKVVLLFSSGLDSYLANKILSEQKDIKLNRIYFDCCKYSKNENEFITMRYNTDTSIFADVTIDYSLRLDRIEEQDSYIPNRNIMFITMASSIFCNADEIYINSMKDDRVIDSNKELFIDYSKILTKSLGREIEIKSLFWNKEKVDVIYEYLSDGGSKFDLLMHTYSCFNEEFIERKMPVYSIIDTITGKKYKYVGLFPVSGCLKCPACFRKMCALTAANIYVPFIGIELALSYKDKIDKNLHPKRHESIIKYLEFLNAKITI